jgi:hypothetical protein
MAAFISVSRKMAAWTFWLTRCMTVHSEHWCLHRQEVTILQQRWPGHHPDSLNHSLTHCSDTVTKYNCNKKHSRTLYVAHNQKGNEFWYDRKVKWELLKQKYFWFVWITRLLWHKLKLQGNALQMPEMEAQTDTWHTWCLSELSIAL